MLVFLAVNGLELSYTQQELADIILQVAAEEKGYYVQFSPVVFKRSAR